jgi:hypothetical protein
MSRCSCAIIVGRERRSWERGRRWEGGKATVPLEDLRSLLLVIKDRVVSALWRLLTWLSKKVSTEISVICPHNGERLTFVRQIGVSWKCARHGRQNALMKVLNCPGRPHAICLARNLFGDERDIVVFSSSGLHCIQSSLVCRL